MSPVKNGECCRRPTVECPRTISPPAHSSRYATDEMPMKKTQPFRFQHFTIEQQRAAMKVGTDAILLGAWAALSSNTASSILDIGTGTGIVALMMAQRFPDARIHAVEIDSEAAAEAAANFQNSPWHDRCQVTQTAIQNFAHEPFDVIVSNPPWFRSGMRSDSAARSLARHDESLSAEDLITSAERLLSPSGRFAVVIPLKDDADFTKKAAALDLSCSRRTIVRPTPDHPPKRVLLEFGRGTTECAETEVSVERRRHEYTPEYAAMTRDFLLRAGLFT